VSMTPVLDAAGNLHNADDGQFAGRVNSRPDKRLAAKIQNADATLRHTAAGVVGSYRGTEDDIADSVQDSWIDLLSRQRPLSELIENEALLKLVSRTIVKRDYSIGGRDGFRHEDFQARRVLNELKAAYLAEHGKPMSNEQIVAAADRIRLEHFPPRRRPRSDFYVTYGQTSLDALMDVGVDPASVNAAVTVPGVDEDEGLGEFSEIEDAAAQALFEHETNAKGRIEVRRQLWRTLTAGTDTPQIARDSLSQHDAASLRTTVTACGGVLTLAQRWVDGDATDAEELALFAPFAGTDIGSLSAAQRMSIHDVLERHGKFAEKIWGEAVKVASRHSSKSVQSVAA